MSEQFASVKSTVEKLQRHVFGNGVLGRAYFVPVRPAHRLIVPAMLRGAERRRTAPEH